MFNSDQLERGDPVCIIGNSIKVKFFPAENPIGKSIKMGGVWLRVVGILEERYVSEASISKLGIRDYNMDVYTPINKSLVTVNTPSTPLAIMPAIFLSVFVRTEPIRRTSPLLTMM